jgi:D-alanyl-lipoteichoic acid acyltransferase DltB (MBOAT superfamily)
MFNYAAGVLVGREVRKAEQNRGGLVLTAAVACNLALLLYFKYTNLFIETFNSVAGTSVALRQITLPLGISFFTFTQIAFLVDSLQGKVDNYSFTRYLLFVTYFPHLIAGPIIHHSQIIPQFSRGSVYRPNWSNIAAGTTILIIGLCKKIFIADNFALIADPIFDLVAHGGHLRLGTAWAGSLAYAMQLYFDFSGYSDMAIGLSLMFNVFLPLNFNSPYKSVNIVDFWRRWHMTLSSFLRDYLYIPLGGNRKGTTRRYVNLFVTMVLGGMWHGAGWTFILWGALHGVYLIVNHAFNAVKQKLGWTSNHFGVSGKIASRTLTFACVIFAWAIFRSDSIESSASIAVSLLTGCAFIQCDSLQYYLLASPVDPRIGVAVSIACGLIAVWTLPNTWTFVFGKSQSLPTRLMGLQWKPSVWWAPVGLAAAVAVISIASNPVSRFLYFQF